MSLRGIRDRFLGRLLTRFPALVKRWAAGRDFRTLDPGDPWVVLKKPLAECHVAVVTTAGVHLRDQAPFDMGNPDGDPSFREIPDGADRDRLTITHDYYDHRDADSDINIVFPLDRLDDLVAENRIAGRAPLHLGFMGHIDGSLVGRLVRETAPAAARLLLESGADCVLLTPA